MEAFAAQQNHFENHVPETLRIRSNRQLLKIILHNLIDNANKYTSDGIVSVGGSQEGPAVRLVVSDTGPGLSGDLVNWINESNAAYPESPDGEPRMHGIGLVIIKELTEILGLEISVSSGHGTRFEILITNIL
ncbi:HAMP domain-containing sensor histidine kinase [Dyadobacter sp. 676]|uniref:histidine kinase n=1 Tax=Dyadobacter sp. 676 TaxID=3088362 RepID=A0AAU8FLP8_9BACT